MLEIVKYDGDAELWDSVVRQARNANFLHFRNFMDYHSDRFCDHSLLALRNGKPIAALPANLSGTTLHSHQGLTYGGWLMTRDCNGSVVLELMDQTIALLRDEGVTEMVYKPTPWIYHNYPTEEDKYALFRHGAKMTACALSSAIPLQTNFLEFNTNAKRALAAASKAGVEVLRSMDVDEFHAMLSSVLMERHGVSPVHSPAELALLMDRFPDNIRLYIACKDFNMVAGVVMFFGAGVAHAQYIASSPEGRECGALSAVFHSLIIQAKIDGYRYFDFGVSTENGGAILNEGLNRQKCGFGGRGVTYDTYTIRV